MAERQQHGVSLADGHALDGKMRRQDWASVWQGASTAHGLALCHDDCGIEDLDGGGEMAGAVLK